MGSESMVKDRGRISRKLQGVPQFKRDESWYTMLPKPDNTPRWKPPSLDGINDGMLDDMEIDEFDLIQREIDKIELHNLKVDIRDTTKRINTLQKAEKQKRRHVRS